MMNNNSTIPGWNFESDACVINQKSPIGLDQDLVELLWKNGQVVLSSQTQRKPVQKSDASSTLRNGVHCGNSSSNLSQQEDETASWIQYQVEDHPMGQELCSSNLLSQLTPCEVEAYKPIKQLEEPKFAKFATPNANLSPQQQNNNIKPINPMPAPRFQVAPDSSNQKTNDFVGGSSSSQKVPKFSHHFSAPAQQKFREKVSGNNNVLQSEGRECSVMTVGSSHCGSNNIIPQEQDTTFSEAVKDCVQRSVPNWSNNKGKSSEMIEATVTSSSGGSGSSLGKTTCSLSTGNHLSLKRKITDADESEEQSEATEPKSGVGNKTSQRSGSSRRNRAAEVHNLSERRRRDRINEKMRTLQQLIPNSNKTDKASMLEEAIEYLKSLQLQLQVMWMGAGMTPVMFPGIQHYMSQMSAMGMAAASQPSLSSMQNPMQIPRMPLDQSNMPSTVSVPHHQTPSNQALMCQNPVLGAFNYQNHQMQNPCLADQYARYMAYHHLMQTASQPINVFGHGSQAVQQSQTMMPPSNNNGTMNVAPNFEDAITAKMGTSTFQQLNNN